MNDSIPPATERPPGRTVLPESILNRIFIELVEAAPHTFFPPALRWIGMWVSAKVNGKEGLGWFPLIISSSFTIFDITSNISLSPLAPPGYRVDTVLHTLCAADFIHPFKVEGEDARLDIRDRLEREKELWITFLGWMRLGYAGVSGLRVITQGRNSDIEETLKIAGIQRRKLTRWVSAHPEIHWSYLRHLSILSVVERAAKEIAQSLPTELVSTILDHLVATHRYRAPISKALLHRQRRLLWRNQFEVNLRTPGDLDKVIHLAEREPSFATGVLVLRLVYFFKFPPSPQRPTSRIHPYGRLKREEDPLRRHLLRALVLLPNLREVLFHSAEAYQYIPAEGRCTWPTQERNGNRVLFIREA